MNLSPDPPRKDFLRLKLTLAAALSLLALGWLCWNAYQDYRDAREELPVIGRLEIVRGEIIHLDEVLTMSARMAAASGNLDWETRYRLFEPQLDQALKEALRLDPAASRGEAAAKTDAANAALVAMEHRAFELVRQRNPAEAQRLLSGAGYENQKRIYAEGMTEFNRHLLQDSDALRAGISGDLRQGAISAITSTVLLILVSLFAYRATRRSRATIVDSNRQLNLKTAELGELNNQLDGTVNERTKELSDSVLASMNMMADAVRQRENAEQAYAQLEQTHEQLLEASRQRGRAEVATNVLHNVGNVLNSVNVSASLVVENVKGPRAAGMAKVVALLREHEADLGSYITKDPKGRHIPALLEQLSQDWLGQQQLVVKELESLRANIDHIREIVAMQQSHAKVSGSAELVNVRDLVEDSLRMNAGTLIKHQVRVIREFAEVPPISVEKHKVLQILVNLVRNAKQACDAVGDAGKRMTLRIAQVDGRIRISVSDNGAGIAPENLTRIFAHGFTTRKDGHGFGLHSGALAATELGGSLSAQSAGPGKGATFTLELAAQSPAVGA
jgi:C4-dicarboxylate-specific signal transduction histidine kinase